MTSYDDLEDLSDSFIHLTRDRTDLTSLNNEKENTFQLELLSKKFDGMNLKGNHEKIALHSTPLVGRKVLHVLNENALNENENGSHGTYTLSDTIDSTDTIEEDSMIGLAKRKDAKVPNNVDNATNYGPIGIDNGKDANNTTNHDPGVSNGVHDMHTHQNLQKSNHGYSQQLDQFIDDISHGQKNRCNNYFVYPSQIENQTSDNKLDQKFQNEPNLHHIHQDLQSNPQSKVSDSDLDSLKSQSGSVSLKPIDNDPPVDAKTTAKDQYLNLNNSNFNENYKQMETNSSLDQPDVEYSPLKLQDSRLHLSPNPINFKKESKILNTKIIKLVKQLNPLLSQKVLINLFDSLQSLLVDGLEDIVVEQSVHSQVSKSEKSSNLRTNLKQFEKASLPPTKTNYEIPKTPKSFDKSPSPIFKLDSQVPITPMQFYQSIPSTGNTKIPSIPNSQDSYLVEQLQQQIKQLTKENTNLQSENLDLNMKINDLNQQILMNDNDRDDNDLNLDDFDNNKNANVNNQEASNLRSQINQLESKLYRLNQTYQELKNEFTWYKSNHEKIDFDSQRETENDKNVRQSTTSFDKHVIEAMTQNYQSQIKSKDDEIKLLKATLDQEIGDKNLILNEHKIPKKFNQKYHQLQLSLLDSKSKVELVNIIKQIMLSLLITNVDNLSMNMNKYGIYLRLSIQFLDKVHDLIYNDRDTIKPSYYIRNQTGFDQDLSQLSGCLQGMIHQIGKNMKNTGL